MFDTSAKTDCTTPYGLPTKRGFVQVSKRLLLSDINRTAKLIVIFLQMYDSGKGAWLAVATLAQLIGVSPNTITKNLRWLETNGLIHRLRKQGRGNVWKVAEYALPSERRSASASQKAS